mmetsp:Transcript_34776/g.98598  ORF Transcript_34776/g.98598 Transcript_34776/m.98598 type:complete len:263 (-) Transcript_34776:666-1454(-)
MLRNRLGKFWWVSFVQRLGSPTCQARMVQSPPAENNWPLCDENVRECTPSAGSCPLRTSVGAKSESSSQLLLLRIKPTLGHRLQTAMSPEWYGAVNMEQRSLPRQSECTTPAVRITWRHWQSRSLHARMVLSADADHSRSSSSTGARTMENTVSECPLRSCAHSPLSVSHPLMMQPVPPAYSIRPPLETTSVWIRSSRPTPDGILCKTWLSCVVLASMNQLRDAVKRFSEMSRPSCWDASAAALGVGDTARARTHPLCSLTM